MNGFFKYLEANNASTNWTEIERIAGIPERTMYKHFSGHQPLPSKHIPEILRALCEVRGSVRIGERDYQFENGTFFWQQAIPDADVECIETINEQGASSFEYRCPQWRGIEDYWGIIETFKPTQDER